MVAPRRCQNCHTTSRTISETRWGSLCLGCSKGIANSVDFLTYTGHSVVDQDGVIVDEPEPDRERATPPTPPNSPQSNKKPPPGT